MSTHRTRVHVALLDPTHPPKAHAQAPLWWTSDDMEGTLNWSGSGTGSDWIVALTTTRARTKTHSLHLATRTTGAAPGDTATAYAYGDYPPLPLLQITYHFYQETAANLAAVDFYLAYNAGTERWSSAFHWDPATNAWIYYTTAWAPIAIPGWSGTGAPSQWHRLTWTIRTDLNQYVTATLDGTTVTLTPTPTIDTGAETATRLNPAVQITAGASPPAELYVDDTKLTEAPAP